MVTLYFTYNHKILYPNLFRVGVLLVLNGSSGLKSAR